ncbi:alpha/beta hydrolase fold domain-containing protein [Trichoderma austrokoningii]
MFKFFLSLWMDILASLLHLSPASDELNLKAASTIAFIRASARGLRPGRLSAAQQGSLNARNDEYLTVRSKLPVPPKNNLAYVVAQAFKSLGNGTETFEHQGCEDVHGDWVGPCKRSAVPSSLRCVSEREQYNTLMSTTTRKTTILYLQGGQFWRRGRGGIKIQHELAHKTGGRTFGLLYRLSPQNPFPAALMDCLAAYLCLLYPTADHLHDPVDARDIYLAGDSAGGNLAVALLKLILEIRSCKACLWWNGEEKTVPLPAGAAVLSPYLDMTRSFPSEEANLQFDIIPARGPPFANQDRCDIWPAKPPRHHVYANDDALLHPLVSPVTVRDWTGCPPIWVCVGEECLADAGLCMAKKMSLASVVVLVEQFSAMPHNFALLCESDSTARAIQSWGEFICGVRDGSLRKPVVVKWGHQKSRLVRQKLSLEMWQNVDRETVLKRMRAQVMKWGPPPR